MYHIILYYIISPHIMSYHNISYHIISYHDISNHIIQYHIMLYNIISYNMISCYIISNHVMSHHIISYHVIIVILTFLSFFFAYSISCSLLLLVDRSTTSFPEVTRNGIPAFDKYRNLVSAYVRFLTFDSQSMANCNIS